MQAVNWIYSQGLTDAEIVGLCDAIMQDVFPQNEYPDEYNYILSIKNQHS